MFSLKNSLLLDKGFEVLAYKNFLDSTRFSLYFKLSNDLFKPISLWGYYSHLNTNNGPSYSSFLSYESNTARANFSNLNMISNGFNAGYFVELNLKGIGFKVFQFENNLFLQLGFSHFYIYRNMNRNIMIKAKRDRILIFGTNKQEVGNTAFEISVLRRPDSYKAKGLQFKNKTYRLKEGKKK